MDGFDKDNYTLKERVRCGDEEVTNPQTIISIRVALMLMAVCQTARKSEMRSKQQLSDAHEN